MVESFKVKVGQSELVGQRAGIWGSYRSLVFLHAGVADKRMWQTHVSTMHNTFQTVAYDRRGFGETVAVDEPFSHVEDLLAVMDHLEISAATLVGCSQGGRIAIDFARVYPHRVTALVLIAPAISGAPAPESFPPEIHALENALDEADEANDLNRINEIEAQMWLDGPLSQAERVGGELRELFLDMNGIALRMPELTQEIEPPSAYEHLHDLTISTLVIWGTLDLPHIQERCRYLIEKLPAVERLEVEGAAHLPSLEQPELIDQAIRDFLG